MNKRLHIIFVFLLLGLLALASFQTAQAHGLGRQQLSDVEAGPFVISVWTDPVEAQQDEIVHVTISVQDEERNFVRDAEIVVESTLFDGQQRQETTASHENAVNQLFYEAVLEPSAGGTWTVTITITDDELGSGTVSFELAVQEKDENDEILEIALPVGGGLIALVIIGLLVKNYRDFQQKLKSEGRL
jgi:hypothetical protein